MKALDLSMYQYYAMKPLFKILGKSNLCDGFLTESLQFSIPYGPKPCHAITYLKIFDFVTPDEYWANGGRIHQLYNYAPYSPQVLHPLVGVLPKRRIGGAPPDNPSFGMTSTKIFQCVLAWRGSPCI